jgi:hypothetical protein
MHPNPNKVVRRYLEAEGRTAELRREAAIKDWLKWIAQPLAVIWKHHRDFVYGPIDDAVDEIIRDLAPKLVKLIGEREVDEDVDEFITGAQAGKWDADQGSFKDKPSGETEDFEEGYEWGYENHETFNGRKLPSGIERAVVEDAIKTFRKRVTEEFIIDLLEKAWNVVNPAHTFKAIVRAVKKHGWKLGVSFALFEIFEHAVLPAIAIWATGDPRWAVLGTLPIGEIVYAVIIRVLGRAPKELDKLDIDGHLDWYEAKFGPARLASCARVAHVAVLRVP